MSEGLITSIWGPSTWNTLHCITFNYPIEPTEEDKQHYKQFFQSLAYVLPCETCRNSYKKHITTPEFELSDEVLQDRDSLTKWLYKLHKKVSHKTGTKYKLTYEDVYDKYSSYIIKCTSLNQKAIPYKNYYNKEAPYLDYDLAICFEQYAKLRGVKKFGSSLDKLKDVDINSDEWIERNIKANEIIKDMRLNTISSLETDGEYKGLPTIIELELIKLLSTTISRRELPNILTKLGFEVINK